MTNAAAAAATAAAPSVCAANAHARARRCSFSSAAAAVGAPTDTAAPSAPVAPSTLNSPTAPAPPAESASDAASVASQYASLLHTLLTINASRKVRLGVETTARLLSALGASVDVSGIVVVHVAGSNGKGSTTVKIARALQLHGLRVGVYTSPHLSSFRERIAVDGRILPAAELVRLLPPMIAAAERLDIPATFFELGTALALAHFRSQRVDVAVVEVGLGGRLDSTNVLQGDLAVISSIALEHTQWLGDTVELIAREKAGILKAGRPALIGPSVPAAVVRTVAAEVGAGPVEQMQGGFDDYDAENSALAARALHILAEETPRGRALLAASPAGGLREELVQRGVRARPPCRFQQVRWDPVSQQGRYLDQDVALEADPAELAELQMTAAESVPVAPALDDVALRALRPVEVVLDVCHNPAAFEKLFEKLRRQYDPTASAAPAATGSPTATAPAVASPASGRRPLDIRAVVGFSSDKDFVSCLHMLMRHCTQVCLVQGDTPRAATASHVLDIARQHSQLQHTRSPTAGCAAMSALVAVPTADMRHSASLGVIAQVQSGR